MEKKHFLKKFENQSAYESQKDSVMRMPHVVLLDDTKEVVFASRENSYASQPFTLVALENGTMNIGMPYDATSMHYALNDGDWVEMTEAVSLTMNADDKVKIKAIGISFSNGCSSIFSSTMAFNAEGNIISLLYGDDFQDKTSLEGMDGECFKTLFMKMNIVSAKNLILPATTLSSHCYYSMFQDCTSLIEAPELPATTLADNCYVYMFNGCTSLTEAPQLLATTLASYCYSGMFKGCSNLNKITMLATDISASNCLYDWVYGVASRGTFIKNAAMTSLPSGINGIPFDWAVENA